MALSSEELDQIRQVVQAELKQAPGRDVWKIVALLTLVSGAVFISVLALHVLVIGGFTIYHLMHSV